MYCSRPECKNPSKLNELRPSVSASILLLKAQNANLTHVKMDLFLILNRSPSVLGLCFRLSGNGPNFVKDPHLFNWLKECTTI